MNNQEKNMWQRKGLLNRWVDFPSVIIACLWGGLIVLFWSHVVSHEEEVNVRRYKSMVIADERVLSEKDVYRRPDLIALPSDISFAPDSEDESAVIDFSDDSGQRGGLPERRDAECRSVSESDNVALAAEAVRDISSADVLPKPTVVIPGEVAGHDKLNVFVGVSGDIGRDVMPVWSESDRDLLFRGKSGWEVEVSLKISDDGKPEYVFLEKASGQGKIDSEIVRILSRQNVWEKVVPGEGNLLISYSPRL
jgi:hypothetical protein